MTKAIRVLAVDPGLANTGFAVIDYKAGRYKLIKYGVFTTSADERLCVRLLTIYNRLLAVIDEYRPVALGIEMLFFARNVTSAMGVSNAIGVIELCAAQNNVPIYEYTPNQIKQSVTGNTKADKETVERCVKLLLNLEAPPKPDHAADAIACALTLINFEGKKLVEAL